jgi:hypothetical protein
VQVAVAALEAGKEMMMLMIVPLRMTILDHDVDPEPMLELPPIVAVDVVVPLLLGMMT